MRTIVEQKLTKISHIWQYYIWKYKFCKVKIKNNEDVLTNYFSDILGYFDDTMDIIFMEREPSNHTDKFSFAMSFLQAIYIHQDFVREMLDIFKIDIDKGSLKKDPLYYMNREIRNELIGHPIRKTKIRTDKVVTKDCEYCGEKISVNKNKSALLSSALFSYQAAKDEIQYLWYHKENNFKFESKTYKIAELRERHGQFLSKYFDVILDRSRAILNEYLNGLGNLEAVIRGGDFNKVIKLAELYFEAIFKSDYAYDKSSLLKIYAKKDNHLRYSNFIDAFYHDLQSSLIETRATVAELFEDNDYESIHHQNSISPKIEFVLKESEYIPSEENEPERDFHYEIGKIFTRRNLMDFEFFGGLLKSKCEGNMLVLEELEHMQANITNEIEYYTSLRLICLELGVEM